MTVAAPVRHLSPSLSTRFSRRQLANGLAIGLMIAASMAYMVIKVLGMEYPLAPQVGDRFVWKSPERESLVVARVMRAPDAWRISHERRHDGSHGYALQRDFFRLADACDLETGVRLELVSASGLDLEFLVLDDRTPARYEKRCPAGALIAVSRAAFADARLSPSSEARVRARTGDAAQEACIPMPGRAFSLNRLPIGHGGIAVPTFGGGQCVITNAGDLRAELLETVYDRPGDTNWVRFRLLSGGVEPGSCSAGEGVILPLAEVRDDLAEACVARAMAFNR